MRNILEATISFLLLLSYFRGFGFITFVYAESVEKALGEASKHVIDNKDVDVKVRKDLLELIFLRSH